MHRSQRLQPVLHLASESETEEARRLYAMRMQLHREEMQLQELMNYQKNYEAGACRSGSVAPQQLSMYQQFLSRLHDALEQQEQKRQHFARMLEQQRQRWNEAHVKVQSLSQLITKYVHEEQRQEARREQRAMDEIAARRFAPGILQ